MNNSRLMSIAIDNAASGYAEKIAREKGLLKLACPSVDYAIRHMSVELVNAGLVDADKMFEFLDERRYREVKTPDIWWND